MPELKDKSINVGVISTVVDLDKIPFADKTREKARLKRLESGPKVDKDNKPFHKAGSNSWAKKKEQRCKKEKRKTKKLASKAHAVCST